MTKCEVVKAMLDIVLSHMTHYQSDFAYDVDTIYTTGNASYVWALRDTGTDMAVLNNDYHKTLCCAAITGGYTDKYYLIKNDSGEDNGYTFTEIDRATAEKL